MKFIIYFILFENLKRMVKINIYNLSCLEFDFMNLFIYYDQRFNLN